MQVKPLQDYILIEPIEEEEQTPAGIVIPDTAKEKPQEGEVVAVGPGRKNEEGKRIEMDVKKGDRVIYKKWGGNDVRVNGKDMLIVREEDVLAVVKG
ncbi:MAG: co-chaperone GroES [Patescibacteria group bacterium]|nr:co-chaperone GroES [Patescibacteria group bacterium]